MNKRTIKSASFPPAFMRIFLHVANTQQTLVVDNLANTRAAYTTLRARLNEFRKAYHDEAVQENDRAKLEIAESMYGAICHNPEQVDGKWRLVISHKHEALGKALDDILPETPLAPPPESSTTTADPDAITVPGGEAQTKALDELFGNDNNKGDTSK